MREQISPVDWNVELFFDIEIIDHQHKEWLNILNDLVEANNTGKKTQAIVTTIRRLKEYTETHFKTEEDYFDQYTYPYGASHKLEHKHFLGTVLEFETRYNTGKFLLASELLEFMRDWITNHIQSTDRQYVDFLRDKGVT